MYHFPKQAVQDFASSLSKKMKEDLFSKNQTKQTSVIKKKLPSLSNTNYIKNVILPLFQTSMGSGARLDLPMLDTDEMSKENALPYYLWGLLYDKYEPPLTKSEKKKLGTTVFLTGYDLRGESNLRKKIYISALTKNLYGPMYQEKVRDFFDFLLDNKNQNKPLMSIYLENFASLYWDLHVDEKKNIPPYVKEIARAFNTVLAIANPINPKDPSESIKFMKNYLIVRKLRSKLQLWLKEKIDEVRSRKVDNPEKTFVYYWLKNMKGDRNTYFDEKDIVFECFHNFLAFNQFGNTIYMIMQQFSGRKKENKLVQDWFKKTMSSSYDKIIKGTPYSSLDLFVMELFRTLSPNGGSISNVDAASAFPSHNYVTTPHLSTSDYYLHWKDAETFNPNRYLDVPTSAEVDAKKSKEMGFAQCPFHKGETKAFGVKSDKTLITNSAYGTAYGVTNGKAAPVCDYAGYAPFGFGYRRCPGEIFNIELIKDFLRKVWNDKVTFKTLRGKDPEQVPVAPGKFVPDNIGFTKSK